MQLALQPVAAGEQAVAIAATGPADEVPACSVLFLALIEAARRRLWIASPYFVPDEVCTRALQAAALRGVDVRVLLPNKADHLLVWLSSFSYVEEMHRVGVRIFRYQPGFQHQKVLLVDDELAAVGTANFDNRSFRLNFEVTALIADREFAGQMEAMFEADFAHADEIDAEELDRKPFWWRLGVAICRLASPVL